MIDNSFDDDTPIKTTINDDLGREAFSIRLAESINNWSGNSLVLGLNGDWGSGKTSIINMALEKIGELKKKDQPLVVKFNPWLVSNRNQIIKSFFDTLIPEIDNKNISNQLKSYGSNLLPLVIKHPTYDKFKSGIKDLYPPFVLVLDFIFQGRIKSLKDLSKQFEEEKTEDRNLEVMKDEIDELIKKGKKILIVIDDIDRLEKDEIKLIFQLVNKLADFSNTIYLLSYDNKIVTKALKDNYPDGLEYLKKIVQINIDIPAISEIKLNYLYFYHLRKFFVLEEKLKKDLEEIFDTFFKCYFKNIRDIKRYMNNVKFSYDLIKDDTYCYDFLFITVIQVFDPVLYRDIYRNKEVFIYTSDPYQILEENKQKQREKFKEILDKNKIPNEILKSGLSHIFPRITYLEKKFDNVYTGATQPELRLRKRIQLEEHFETYFKFGVPDWELSKVEFDTIFDSIDDPTDFHEKFSKLDDNKKIKFLEIVNINIKPHAIDVENDKLDVPEFKVKKLFDYYICFSYLLSDPVFRIMELLAEEYIKKYDPYLKTAQKLIKKAKNPVPSCYLLEGLYEENIDKKTLDNVKIICAERIKDYVTRKGFKNLKYLPFLLRFWREAYDKDKVNDYILNVKDDSLMILIDYYASLRPDDVLNVLFEDFELDKKENFNKFSNRLDDLLSKNKFYNDDVKNINRIKKKLSEN